MWQRNELVTSQRGDPPTRLGCLRSRQREARRLITKAASDLITDVYQKVREGHRFDLLERGFQSATERNSSHTSVSTVHAPCGWQQKILKSWKSNWIRKETRKIKNAHQRRTAIKREERQQATLKKCCTTRKSFSLWLKSGIPTKLKWKDFVPWLKTSVWITSKTFWKKKRSSINFGQIFDFSFSKETEASYWRRGDLPWINFENLEEE